MERTRQRRPDISGLVTTQIPFDGYTRVLEALKTLPEKERKAHLRNLCVTDLYFLLRYALNRPDLEHPWLYARCVEVQNNPDGYLDLWAREHYKSTIITFAKTIQDILSSHGDTPLPKWKGREVTFGIFSFNRGIALDFVSQIKSELEKNRLLMDLFPDILYQEPNREADSWSVMGGLTVKRNSNPKEATLEGWGLVDSMPTGRHFFGRIYDDVITEKFARTPEMIAKSTESWELSLNLGARGGFERYVGTRYNYNDTYKVIMQRGTAKPRVYPGTVDGTVTGEPVLLSTEELEAKRRSMGPYIFGCQILQNPVADETQGFKRDWLVYYHDRFNTTGMNIYILCDPASKKKKTSDYTTMAVIGLAADGNYYLLDLVRDRFNLTQRTEMLLHLHRKWTRSPAGGGSLIRGVGYEEYGLQADIEHIQGEQATQNYRFAITPLGGKIAKEDRIKGLVPIFEQGRFYLPDAIPYTQYDGKTLDLIEVLLVTEYDPFPAVVHDDILDVLARIRDPALNATFPKHQESKDVDRYAKRRRSRSGSWYTR